MTELLLKLFAPLLIKLGETLIKLVGEWFRAEFLDPKEEDPDGILRKKRFDAAAREILKRAHNTSE